MTTSEEGTEVEKYVGIPEQPVEDEGSTSVPASAEDPATTPSTSPLPSPVDTEPRETSEVHRSFSNGSTCSHAGEQEEEGAMKQIKVTMPDGTKKDVKVWSHESLAQKKSSRLTRKPTILEVHIQRNRTFSIRSQLSAISQGEKPIPQYRLRIAVGLMFACLIMSIVIIYIFHYHHQQYLTSIVRIHVDADHRLFWLPADYRDTRIESAVLTVVVGVDLPWQVLPYDCSQQPYRDNHMCLQWKGYAQLWIHYEVQGNVSAFHFQWTPYQYITTLRDCLKLHGPLYGGGLQQRQSWPLDATDLPQTQYVTAVRYDASPFGGILQPVWVTAHKIAIEVEQHTSLYVAIGNRSLIPPDILSSHFSEYDTGEEDGMYGTDSDRYMCIAADTGYSPFSVTNNNPVPFLNYTLHVGTNMSGIVKHVMQKYAEDDCLLRMRNSSCEELVVDNNCTILLENMESMENIPDTPINCSSDSPSVTAYCFFSAENPDCQVPSMELLGSPLWSTFPYLDWNVTAKDIIEFAAEVRLLDQHGKLLLSSGWEAHLGDLKFDELRYPNASDFIAELHTMGYQVWTSVHSAVSVASSRFHEGLQGQHFVFDAGGIAPGLVQLSLNSNSNTFFSAVTDLVPSAMDWWSTALFKLQNMTGVDSFLFLGGDVHSLPYNAQFHGQYASANDYTTHFQQFAAQFGDAVILTASYSHSASRAWLALPNLNSTWEDLQLVIPQVLSVSVSGYPFVIPGVIGGMSHEPPEELYVRWAQLCAFLPVMHFSNPPTKYGNETLKLVQDAIDIHNEKVVPVIQQHSRMSPLQIQPIIRPIWWVDDELEVTKISNQFLVGDELLIAPVVEQGVTRKHIYIPQGSWTDPQSYLIIHGPTWIEYNIMPDTVPHFIRI